ncbi:MAG TPA: outer membrane protein assembly factor BamA [Thermoanaerobaculia bacterium]|nr:outer membrane protein assembly factor BamA [Thermoanaerobaculia bacterium]
MRCLALLTLLLLPFGPALAQQAPPVASAATPLSVPPDPALERDQPLDGEAEPAPQGPPVTAIEIRSDVDFDEEERGELRALIDIQIGQPLTDAEVRHALRDVQAAGLAPVVELYTREEGEGIVAILVLRPVTRVERVALEGELGLDEGDLRRAIPQQEGEALSEERILQGVYALKDLYSENGYFDAQAQLRIETDPRREEATVTYEVNAGPRARVSEILFDGDIAPFEPAALLKELRIQAGEPYRQRLAEDGADRLQRWLVRQQYGTARVDPPRTEHLPAPEGGVRLTYPVTVGPKIEVKVEGADVDRLRRRGLLPFLGDAGYDEALVLQAVARIKTDYQQQGHYHVEVTSREDRQDGVLRLTLTIQPGSEYTIESIGFEDNRTFTGAQLSALMTTSRRSLLGRLGGGGRLVQSELDQDLENIRSFYALQGFARAEIGPARVAESGDRLRVTIPIVEGPRQQVGHISFEGNEQLKEEDLRKLIAQPVTQEFDAPGLADGGPYHPVLQEYALNTLRLAYTLRGYVQVQVSVRTQETAAATETEPGTVDLAFEILEGPQQVVDHIIVRGNRRTDSDVIRRTINLRPGDPVSDSKLLEIESQLFRLGIFSRVDAEMTRLGLGFSQRDVLIRVEEGRSRRLTYGVGYEYDGQGNPRGLLGYTDNNVLGRAYSLRADLRLSQRDSRFRLVFDQPYVWQLPITLTSLLFWEDETRLDKPYEVTRYGARTEASRTFGKRRVSFGLDYRQVELNLEPGLALSDVDRQDRPYRLASLVPSFFWDRRDDPLTPTRGWSSLLQLQYAFPVLDADAEFLKTFAQQTWYRPLGRFGVFASSLRIGGIEPFQKLAGGDPNLPDDLPNSDVFIDERFFAGGRNTHRGYERDRLGIRNQTLVCRKPAAECGPGDYQPVGGNGLLLVNLEYQFPVAGAFGGTVFYDTGNVWADWRDIDFGELKPGAGLGVRYLSPIGPIRGEVGWPLDLDPGEERQPVYFLSFGTAF